MGSTKSKLSDLILEVLEWSNIKGFLKFEHRDSQILKSIEEHGESAKAVLKKDILEVKDGIGDIMVTLINVGTLSGFDPLDLKLPSVPGEGAALKITTEAGCLRDCMKFLVTLKQDDYKRAVKSLKDLAFIYNTTLEECLSDVLDIITKRTGKTVDGVFVKDNKE